MEMLCYLRILEHPAMHREDPESAQASKTHLETCL